LAALSTPLEARYGGVIAGSLAGRGRVLAVLLALLLLAALAALLWAD
jgi:hypothetical protein